MNLLVDNISFLLKNPNNLMENKQIESLHFG